MSLVDFRHRGSLPEEPVKGSFYWIDNNGDTQIWFSPGIRKAEMVLLNEKFDESSFQSLVERLTTVESRIGELKGEILSEIDLSPYLKDSDLDPIRERLNNIKTEILNEIELREYLTEDDLTGYAKKEDLELTDSDYDEIAERVNEKTLKLTWKEI